MHKSINSFKVVLIVMVGRDDRDLFLNSAGMRGDQKYRYIEKTPKSYWPEVYILVLELLESSPDSHGLACRCGPD